MKKSTLFTLWGIMFIICSGLGFIPEPAGALRFLLTALSLAFFLPPALLLHRGDRDCVRLVRNLSALSLLITMVAIIANVLSALSTQFWGDALYGVLVIVSSPMVCSGCWALSLFGWACLLMVSLKLLRK